MFPYTFEIVTAITLTVIGVILALYFIVLKRKGWLREEDSHGSYYRCPNPECRKIFDKPVVLSDLSQNPTRLHPACPHCGFELETVSPAKTSEKLEKAVKTPHVDEPLERVEAPITKEKLSSPPPKSLQARPPECRHFFGYLKKIPKNTQIPDECFGCLRMVDCLYYDVSQ